MLSFSSNGGWKERQAFILWVIVSISPVRQNYLFTASALNTIYTPRTQGCPSNANPDEHADAKTKYYHPCVTKGAIKDFILIFFISTMPSDFIRADCDLLVERRERDG